MLWLAGLIEIFRFNFNDFMLFDFGRVESHMIANSVALYKVFTTQNDARLSTTMNEKKEKYTNFKHYKNCRI